MENNKITKNIRKTLRAIAKSLPPMVHKNEKVMQRVAGSTLIENGVTKSKAVGAIYADKYYAQEIPKDVNHYNEIEKAYIKLGKVGVFKYCQSINAIVNPPAEETKQIA